MSIVGKIIHIEGVDGTGKTTQVKRLASHLRDKGVPVIEARQPGHTELGEDLRKTLFERNIPMSQAAQRALHATDHINFVEEVYKLHGDSVVVCDRYTPMSNLVYGHYGEGVDAGYARNLNAIASQGLFPDLIIVLTISRDTMMRRLDNRNGSYDNLNEYDFKSAEFKNKIREGYTAVGEHMHVVENWRTVSISAEGDEDEVFSKILEEIEERFCI